ncbi:hypothetical protein BGX26_010770 [Mortierella sp. AD094]|nr:hypothetical protein BGX26_010770 [Mortierella sp. AD094]
MPGPGNTCVVYTRVKVNLMKAALCPQSPTTLGHSQPHIPLARVTPTSYASKAAFPRVYRKLLPYDEVMKNTCDLFDNKKAGDIVLL